MGKHLLKVALFFLLGNLYSQKLHFNRNSIELNEYLELSVSLEREKIVKISVFPELKGFEKHDSLRTNHSYTMQYKPIQAGKYMLPPITMSVNQLKATHGAYTVTVVANSHFSNFFKGEERKTSQKPEEKVTYKKEVLDLVPKEDVFLALKHSKDEVYVGEGFYASVNLYIIEKKADKYDFVDFENSYNILIKNWRPSNCLEENIPIEKIENEYVTLSGQKYIKYKLYESVFYPINPQELTFKSSSLAMLKTKLLGLKKDTVQIKLESIKFKVNKLPNVVLGEPVNVGKFTLHEAISNHNVHVGQSINYTFKISGEGNIANLSKPILEISDKELEIYESKISVTSRHEEEKISGDVTFHYHITPLKSGKLYLQNHIHWTYFDPSTGRKDTLRSRIVINSKGDFASNQMIAANQIDGFYKIIESQNSKLRNADSNDQFKKWANIGFIIMLSFTLLFVFKGSNNKNRQ